MSYCKAGEKATVFYKFPDKQELKHVTLKTPIEVVAQSITTTGYMPGVAYDCDYWLDSYNMDTGALTSSYHYAPDFKNKIFGTLSGGFSSYYPPFVILPVDWGGYTGFSQFCRHQNYQIPVEHSDSRGNRVKSYFNFLGFNYRPWRQDSYCHQPYVPRDVKFVRIDGKPEPLKYELIVTGFDGTQFKDYGLNMPTFKVSCGDCPEGTKRCESSGYPGFCCIPCDEIATRINRLISRI